MKRYRFSYRETIVTVLTEDDEYYEVAVEAILEARSEIERYIIANPEFYISYEPIECEAVGIVEEMCVAAKIANVGPMASVAGTIAGYAVRKMKEAGAKLAVVDNGGDIAMSTDREIVVGVYPTSFAFVIEPKEFYAVCSSSGKIGHSVSFGHADVATVLGCNAAICDALATALCNGVKKDFGKEELGDYVSDFYDRFSSHVDGIFVVKDEFVAYAGDLPEIVKAEVRPDIISRG